jgi:hypothetical protein
MAYVPAKGDALFMPSGLAGNHLFIVLTGINIATSYGTHLIANFSSIKPSVPHDTSCLVVPGEHPFITTPSYVEYQFAEIWMAIDLGSGVDAGRFTKHNYAVADALLARIRSGLMISSFTPRKCKSYLTRFANNP